MKTKSVWMMASVALFCAASHGDEKGKEAAVKPEKVKLDVLKPDIVKPAAASDYVPFVVPLPKDESGFATKPPEGGVIKVLPNKGLLKPALKVPSQKPPVLQLPPGYLRQLPPDYLRQLPPDYLQQYQQRLRPRSSESAAMDSLRASQRWKMTNASLSTVLSTIEKVYKVDIVVCFSPERLREDVKITMSLTGETVEQKLDSLKALGLVWRNIGDTYYVAWSENDLPPLQNAITPAPQ